MLLLLCTNWGAASMMPIKPIGAERRESLVL